MVGVQQRAELVRYDAKVADFVPYLGGIPATDVDFSRDVMGDLRQQPEARYGAANSTAPPAFNSLTRPCTQPAHWSPDGQQIAFPEAFRVSMAVFLISKDGGSPQPLTAENAV